MNIKRYTNEHFDALVGLLQVVFPDEPAHNAPEKMITQKLGVDDLIFLSFDKQTITGSCMAGYDGHRGWLYAVAVHPDYRRNGVGQALVQHAVSELQQLGCDKVNLQIRPDNTAVAAFYQSLGFKVEERLSMGFKIPSQRN